MTLELTAGEQNLQITKWHASRQMDKKDSSPEVL